MLQLIVQYLRLGQYSTYVLEDWLWVFRLLVVVL